jgi:benzoyl-CoA reductase/2-hydroxyglutaryl-CoA dehydratase subunit BcrC/BadD/HgdB
MSTGAVDYTSMWKDLGLNLEKHDMLLTVLGQLYQDVYLTQKNRPKGMEYFDFVMSEVHGLRIREIVDAKKAGRPVVGSFCVFVPEELILAVDGVSVGLCAGADFGTEKAEQYVPRSTCALIKSFFGFALEQACPYMNACDVVVGENTCDGKKKAYEMFKDLIPRLYVIDLPQVKTEEGRKLLQAEYRRFAAELENLSGRKLTVASLKAAIDKVNKKRSAVHRLAALRAASPAPISGLDSLLVNQVYFYDDPERFTGSVNAICDELEGRISQKVGVFSKDAARILVSGCPMAVPNWKLHGLIEGANAVVVGEESCVGERGTQNLTEAQGNSVDELIDAIAERYFAIDCAIFTPNPSRLDHIKKMAEEYKADGVIHYALQFCTPYQMESTIIERELEKAGIPVLRVDTSYGTDDIEQLRTRVEAFVERVKG